MHLFLCLLTGWCYYSTYKYLNRLYFDCKTKLWLGKENIVLHKKDKCSDINEQDTSFLDCKHKHMLKSGGPPDKVRVLYHLLPIELFGSKAE